jgi:hypothetical protein
MSRVDPANFSWTQGRDNLKTYINKDGLGLGFCSRCGTTLCGIASGEVMGINLGTLDGNPEVRITEHIFVGSKANWDEIGGSAPQFEKGPNG